MAITSRGATPAQILHAPRAAALVLPTRRRDELSPDELAEASEAFRLFDTAGTGSIDYLEFKSCLRALGFAPTREELASIVREFDREGTGRVTREAFVEVCSRMYSDRPADERLAQAFALFDETGSGTITRRDLKRVFREIGEPIDDEECAAMIDEFDANKDGLIDPADFRAVLSEAMMSGF